MKKRILTVLCCVLVILSCVHAMADGLGTFYNEYIGAKYITGGVDLNEEDATPYTTNAGALHIWYPDGLQRVVMYDAGNCAIVEGTTAQADMFLRTCAACLYVVFGINSAKDAYGDLLRLYIDTPTKNTDPSIWGNWAFRITFDESYSVFQFIIARK